MVRQASFAVAIIGLGWLALGFLAYALFAAISPVLGLAVAGLITAGACLVLLGLLALCWPRTSIARVAAETDLAAIARIAADRPLIGVAMSALLGAAKAMEQKPSH